MNFKVVVLGMMIFMLASSIVQAKPIQNPDGSTPLVHWAILKSKDGQMEAMQSYAAKYVAPYAVREEGTYVLYGGVDKNQPNVLRLLEIYKDEAAYQLHRGSEGFKQYQKAREDVMVSLHIMEADPIVLESKTSGEGKTVRMARLEIDRKKLSVYKEALKEQIEKSVALEPGVLALMATSEKENPNIIHILGIYADDEAYEKHIGSAHFMNYQKVVGPMILGQNLIENLPTTVRLPGKPAMQKCEFNYDNKMGERD